MTKERIEAIAKILYIQRPLLRVSLDCGGVGFCLSRENFMELMSLFSNSAELRKDMKEYLEGFTDTA